MGEWIYKRERTKIAETKEFQSLVEAHRLFHLCAYGVLKLILDGKNEEAMTLLDGAYTVLELRLLEAILDLGDLE